MSNKPQHIIVHHSITPRDLNSDITETSFNNTHKNRGFPASYFKGNTWHIGYHYVIFGDGEVRQYRAHKTVGAHCKEESMNFKSIGICLTGNFDVEYPSKAQVDALRDLVGFLREELSIPVKNIAPHRKYATYKSCWGKNLPDDPNELLDSNVEEKVKSAIEWCKEHLPEAEWDGVKEGEAERFRSLAKRMKTWFT